MYVERALEKKILTLSEKFPVLTLTGPLYCGKSTLLKHCFPDYRYVSLEDHDVREFALQDPRGFLESFGIHTIIDEAQHAPKLFSYLQTKVDSDNTAGRYILSGSHEFLLMQQISQSLAGRCAVLRLAPFSVAELSAASLMPEDLDTWLFQGGYPRLYEADIAPPDYFSSYIQTYVERDVRLIRNITDHNAFVRFVKICAARVGTMLNYQSLAQDAGISVPTVKEWISILELSNIIYLLQPHYHNYGKRLTKAPKLYFYDTALAIALLGLREQGQVATHYLRGNLFENMVVSEYVKLFLFQGRVPPLSYWRDRTQREVDLLIEDGATLHAVEIKAGATMRSEHFEGLSYLQGITPLKPEHSSVVWAGALEVETAHGRYVSYKNIGREVFPL